MYSVESQPTFRRSISPPYSDSKKKPSRIPADLSSALIFFCSAYSMLNMEVIYSSETSVDFQLTTQCYIPEYSTLQYCL
jgi:hypothetical protein